MLNNFLNKITMYRLVLYYLLALIGIGTVLGFLEILPFGGLNLIFSTVFLLFCCWVTNAVFAKTFEVHTNVESVYISALILALIITPVKTVHDLPFLFWASVIAMSGKYILALKKRHIFNPAALAVFLPSVFFGTAASWWIGNLPMFLPVLIGGILIVQRIRKWEMVLTCFTTAILTALAVNFFGGPDIISLMQKMFFVSPLLFFVFVMVTEPLTSPHLKNLQIIFGTIVGFLFVPKIHFGSLYTTPESALLIGNIFAYAVVPKVKLLFRLKETAQLSPDIYNFSFTPETNISFAPGQYMEWTVPHNNPDSRGIRREFSIASSPTEKEIKLGVKINEPSSSFKKALLQLQPGQTITASKLSGDFTLPDDLSTKLVFIAGGIGITPFRSMVKYLIDTNQKKDIVLLYSVKNPQDIVYKSIFDEALNKFGLKTIYSTERFTTDKIAAEVPDYKERVFYISGPNSMVSGFKQTLVEMGVEGSKIKTDYFPGFA